MCAHRVTDPFDPQPAPAPVPQLPWPHRAPRAAAGLGDAAPSAGASPGNERCWRRYRSAPAPAAA